MLLQSSGQSSLGAAEHLNLSLNNGSSGSGSSGGGALEQECQLDAIESRLKEGWTVHTAKEGRIYYCNHITRTASWLPPADSWGQHLEQLPYGWEKALDQKGRPYYINHLNKTTTYEAPDCYKYDESPPEPRIVILQRSSTMGFGFVAGSERPVIVRFVTESGPSVNKLEPGDQILAVNGEDVKDAPRDHVIQLVRACDHQVALLVCQPLFNGGAGRKSTLLSATKKAKLRTRPSRVRFAESVCVNGAPLFPPSAFSLGDICVPPMANVLKVFLENGQTKSFKYDATTTVQDVVTSLRDKLCLTAGEHFSLVLEHVKTLKRNKLTLLDPQETLARIASRPGAHKLRCLFRVTFVPVSAATLAQKDLNSLDYLYMQCCNDVVQERFAPELLPDVALRLAALQMHQHALANNISPAKLTVKLVEREFGLERFVPASLIDGMKRKELRRLISHFLKLNAQMTGSSTKTLTQLQSKIHYLDIVSGLPSYGAKCFSTNSRSNVESVLLLSPRFGFSQISDVTKTMPKSISAIEDVARVVAIREDDIFYSVSIYIQPDRLVTFSMEDRDASEFALVLAGYYKLLTGKDLRVDKEREIYVEDIAPPYLSLHSVLPAQWSYLPFAQTSTHCMAFSMPPPYHTTKKLSISKMDVNQQPCDRNMNTTMSNQNHKTTMGMDDFGFDIHSVLSMEILEGTGKGGNNINGLIEAKNEEVLKRVAEMQKMVESSERYLNEQCELMDEYEQTPLRAPWSGASIGEDSDTESLASSKLSSNEDAPPPGVLKHSDSLILLAESINHDLSGITKGLNLISDDTESNKAPSLQGTPQISRRSQGLSQILSELQSLGNDLSQSESDSESVCTPNNSPIRLRNNSEKSNSKQFRTSFGLHSPDSILGSDTKDNNLKDYLRQLREASSNNAEDEATDLAAQKLTELYGFELMDETIIETDADLIDLRAFPPPQTPDELDAFTVIEAPPTGFGDDTSKTSSSTDRESNFEEFLAKVIIAPPGLKITPCKELTPEEIMSFIIPPPPGHDGDEFSNNKPKETEPLVPKQNQLIENHHYNTKFPYVANGKAIIPKVQDDEEEELYINSIQSKKRFFENHIETVAKTSQPTQANKIVAHVIEYATVGRKGPFSCCTKSKKDDSPPLTPPENVPLELPPKSLKVSPTKPPIRPPKNPDLQNRMNSLPRSKLNGNATRLYELEPTPPQLPPRTAEDFKPVIVAPPKKPPLPPVPMKPILKSPIPILKHTSSQDGSPVRVAGIGSPHLHRNLNAYQKIDRAFNDVASYESSCSPIPAPRTNGHFRSLSDCPPVCLKNPGSDKKPQLSLLCSPQMARKTSISTSGSVPSSPQLSNRNGHVVNPETLLQKTVIAMDGLLVKLDQVAANCSAAQSAGGGSCIDEGQYQISRDQLTEQGLQLVSASKLLVVSLSHPNLTALPENLASCLTAFRNITELAKDLSRFTSTPLQTRNIVLKVHDVASSFRELVSCKIGPLGAGQLALQAECLANALASLLRSLRVFSP